MGKKIKIAVVINNRANYARIKSFLINSKNNKKIQIDLILAASSVVEKFGELENIIKKDRLKVSKKLYTIIEGDRPVTMAKTTAIVSFIAPSKATFFAKSGRSFAGCIFM